MQPALTPKIIEDVRLNTRTTTKLIPMCDQRLIYHHLDYPPPDKRNCMYRSVICKLNYLAKCNQTDIVYVVYQCAHLSLNPRKEHTNAVECIANYLKRTSGLGISFNPEISKSLSVLLMPIFVETGPAHLPMLTLPLPSTAQVGLSHMQFAKSFWNLRYRLTWPLLPLWMSTSLCHQRSTTSSLS